MKKLLSITLVGMALLSSSTSAFAANGVSEMATKGGQHVAECAQKMDKGISECLQMFACKDGI